MEVSLVTDRPDFTEATTTVGRGVAQIEFGYPYLFDDDQRVSDKVHSIGDPRLRYGVFAEWLGNHGFSVDGRPNSGESGHRWANAGPDLELSRSWTFSYTLTDQWGADTEWFALSPHSADTAKVEHYFNGGFTYLLS